MVGAITTGGTVVKSCRVRKVENHWTSVNENSLSVNWKKNTNKNPEQF